MLQLTRVVCEHCGDTELTGFANILAVIVIALLWAFKSWFDSQTRN